MKDYRMATGFEALMGYLYLTEQFDRMAELLGKGLEQRRWVDGNAINIVINHDEENRWNRKNKQENRFEETMIEGRNAVLEAFRSGKTVDKLFVLDGCQDGPVKTITREAKKQNTIIHYGGEGETRPAF